MFLCINFRLHRVELANYADGCSDRVNTDGPSQLRNFLKSIIWINIKYVSVIYVVSSTNMESNVYDYYRLLIIMRLCSNDFNWLRVLSLPHQPNAI